MHEWTDELRDRCRDTCAFYGEPPCFELHKLSSDCREPLGPCIDCIDGKPSPWEGHDARQR